MNILGVMCSPRKRGNTKILLDEALAGAAESGATTDMILAGELNIAPCDGCLSCMKTQKCHIKDDMQEAYAKVLAADGIIFATPVYFLGPTAQAKTFVDRLYVQYRQQRLANKVGGIIGVAGRLGHSQIWNFFNGFFALNRMIPTDFVGGFGRGDGDVRCDKHAMKSAWELGRLVTAVANKHLTLPEEFDDTLNRVVSKKYGIDMGVRTGQVRKGVERRT